MLHIKDQVRFEIFTRVLAGLMAHPKSCDGYDVQCDYPEDHLEVEVAARITDAAVVRLMSADVLTGGLPAPTMATPDGTYNDE